MMKKIMIITMPIILAVSVIMVLNSANVNVFGQANQTIPKTIKPAPEAIKHQQRAIKPAPAAIKHLMTSY